MSACREELELLKNHPHPTDADYVLRDRIAVLTESP